MRPYNLALRERAVDAAKQTVPGNSLALALRFFTRSV